MINHLDVDRENVIIAHDHAPLGLFARVKATDTTHASVQTHVHRTNINDAWTGLSCRSHQISVFSITYFSTSMETLYEISFIGHLLW